ncbi:helix-turn-helix domain-containing protein [Psychroserpens mesophilus]|uniref:helix-turn-helix domain-containing protein n=1 Tax=Psychroserpens mesophilus TaxID=325473 RepID=UPI003D64AE3C
MKTIDLKVNTTVSLFSNLKNELGGTLTSKLNEYELIFNGDFGHGIVKGIKMPNNITFLEFDAEFNTDIHLKIEGSKNSIINFLYCNKGKLSHAFGEQTPKHTLETFQTGISANIVTESNTLCFYKGIQTNATIISVNTFMQDATICSSNAMLYETFLKDKKEDYLHLGSYNLKITEYIKQLNAIKQEGVVKLLLTEGLINLILALEVEQHKLDVQKNQDAFGTLTKSEISDIKELSDYINNYPETNIGVNALCAKIGLSPVKVQEGFKLMHGKTLNEYIRYVRVKKSEDLIKTTDLNISEIVYTLGLSSRSYFSHIFKDMYNCSPSEYRQKNRLAATA